MTFVYGSEYRLKVHHLGGDASLVCSPQSLIGKRLIARFSRPIQADAAVAIYGHDSLVLGEVQACWQEGNAIFGAIALRETLTGLSEWAEMFDWRARPRPTAESGPAGKSDATSDRAA